jgi:hypothetical protein
MGEQSPRQRPKTERWFPTTAPGGKRKKAEHGCLEEESDGKAKYYAAVKKLRPIPEFHITPTEVTESILKHWDARPREKRGKKVEEPSIQSIMLLVRFFFNVASPKAFEECQEMCCKPHPGIVKLPAWWNLLQVHRVWTLHALNLLRPSMEEAFLSDLEALL